MCAQIMVKAGHFCPAVAAGISLRMKLGDVGLSLWGSHRLTLSSVPLELPLPPMMFFAIWIKLANVVAVQCPHDADPGEHCWRGPRLRNQDQGLNGGLPFLDLLFRLRQFLDVSGSVLQSDKLATARQRDGVLAVGEDVKRS